MIDKLKLNRIQGSVRIIDSKTHPILDSTILNTVRFVELSWISRLIEDVQCEIFINPHNAPLKFHIQPIDKENEKLIADALSPKIPANFNLEFAVMDFFKYCVAHIVGFGEAVYEVVFFEDENGQKVNFEFEPIYPFTTVKNGDKTFQYLNPDRSIELTPKNIKVFRLPEDLNNKLEDVRANLSKLGLQSDPLIESIKLGLVNVGKPISWNPWYGLEEKEITKNKIIEHLEFVKFVIEIRDHVLKLLNKYILEISEQLGFTAQIEVIGLLSKEDITYLEQQFITGNKTPKDVINYKI